MQKFWLKISFLSILLLWGCGSGRKLTDNPQPLGIVPFTASNLTAEAADLNRRLLKDLRNSGSFYLTVLDSAPEFYDLTRMQSASDSSLKWILTGNFELESISREKGKIPLLIYKPCTAITVKLLYRLYSTEKKGWDDIGEVIAKKKKGGDYQLIEFDKTDPSLAPTAGERQLMREAAYEELSAQLIKRIEARMKIKK